MVVAMLYGATIPLLLPLGTTPVVPPEGSGGSAVNFDDVLMGFGWMLFFTLVIPITT